MSNQFIIFMQTLKEEELEADIQRPAINSI